MTTQEQLFFQRVRLTRAAHQNMSTIQACQKVCERDRQIFEQYLTLSDHAKQTFLSAFAAECYTTIHGSVVEP